MIVMKFGGSSVDSAASIARVAEIVRDHLDRRPVVVVSAMAKTTRRLDAAAAAAARGDRMEAMAVLSELYDFHWRESSAVVGPGGRSRLAAVIDDSFEELSGLVAELEATRRLTPRSSDAVAAYGEVLSSSILALALSDAGLDAEFLDCRRLIVTDDAFTRARPLYEATDARLREAVPPLVARGAVPVLGGYVGATREGVVTTLGKEGSDFSAAIVGAALGADEVQIWTDVDGILTADPHLVPAARRIRTLSFGEALELACSGSKKPHPGTLEPASRSGVPIRILNSRHPGAEGTLIGRRAADAPPRIKSIACRANAHLLAAAAGVHAGNGFLPGVFAVVERFRPALMVLDAADAGAALALDRGERLDEVRAALERAADVELSPGRATVSLVSDDLLASPDLVREVLATARDFDPRAVLQGGAGPSVRFLVDEAAAPAAVARLHERLFPGDPAEPIP